MAPKGPKFATESTLREEFIVERLDRGNYRLVRRTAPPNDVDWPLACPEKGYFVPIESESTDTL